MKCIASVTTRSFNKKELIEFIENTFGDEPGDIGVITETLIREDDTKIKSQSVTFALPLKY